jgi:hypothetical protein
LRSSARLDRAGGVAQDFAEIRVNESRLLTPQEAEATVDDRIERFGLGALPRVSVTGLADGQWLVRWEQNERTVMPMTRDAWHAWLEEFIGPLDAGDLVTTES